MADPQVQICRLQVRSDITLCEPRARSRDMRRRGHEAASCEWLCLTGSCGSAEQAYHALGKPRHRIEGQLRSYPSTVRRSAASHARTTSSLLPGLSSALAARLLSPSPLHHSRAGALESACSCTPAFVNAVSHAYARKHGARPSRPRHTGWGSPCRSCARHASCSVSSVTSHEDTQIRQHVASAAWVV